MDELDYIFDELRKATITLRTIKSEEEKQKMISQIQKYIEELARLYIIKE